jgi:hypothetical protein
MYIQLATVRSSIRPFNFKTWRPIRYTFSLANQQIDSIKWKLRNTDVAKDRVYRIHEDCALLTDALLGIFQRDDKGLHASHIFGLRPCPSLHYVALGVFDSCEANARAKTPREGALPSPALNFGVPEN